MKSSVSSILGTCKANFSLIKVFKSSLKSLSSIINFFNYLQALEPCEYMPGLRINESNTHVSYHQHALRLVVIKMFEPNLWNSLPTVYLCVLLALIRLSNKRKKGKKSGKRIFFDSFMSNHVLLVFWHNCSVFLLSFLLYPVIALLVMPDFYWVGLLCLFIFYSFSLCECVFVAVKHLKVCEKCCINKACLNSVVF